jgi:leader peptidase (prepilin peptidase)/N-methyltransferase
VIAVSLEHDDIRRVDIGAGIYVGVAATEPVTETPEPVPGSSWGVRPDSLVLGAGLALLALVRLGATRDGILAAGVLAVLAVLSAIDLRWRVLPNKIVLPATAAVLAYQLASSPDRATEWAVAAIGAATLLLLPSLIQPGAIGMGDVKLAALLGATLGAGVLSALMLGFLALVPAALVVLIRRGAAGRRATLPLGPFLAFGGAVVLLV